MRKENYKYVKKLGEKVVYTIAGLALKEKGEISELCVRALIEK